MKYSIEIVKEKSQFFFFTLRRMFYLPFSLFIFISLLVHNFIIFPPQFLLFPPPQLCYFPSSMFYSLLGACKLQCIKVNSNSGIKKNIKSEIL